MSVNLLNFLKNTLSKDGDLKKRKKQLIRLERILAPKLMLNRPVEPVLLQKLAHLRAKVAQIADLEGVGGNPKADIWLQSHGFSTNGQPVHTNLTHN